MKIKQTVTAPATPEEAQDLLDLANNLYQQVDYVFNRMALRRKSDRELLQHVNMIIPDNPDPESNTRIENLRKQILDIHARQPTS